MIVRSLLLLSVLFVTACSSSSKEGMESSIPASEREAITSGAPGAAGLNPDGTGFETITVYGDDLGPDAAATQDYLVGTIGDRVQFGYDSYTLTNDARQVLLAQAKWLQRFPELTVTVEGHCDERGTREYNLALGERRASSVKTYLAALGVDPTRINVVSYGKERPVEAGSNDAAWAKNRRAVTVIE